MPPEIGNSTVFTQVDANNTSGTQPSFPEGQSPSSLNDGMRALQGAITREWNWRNYTLTSGGAADVQTLTYAVAPAAYYNGQRFGFIAGFTNATTTPTLNVNGLGATTMKKMSAGVASALVAGDITAGNFYEATYNTSGSAFIITNGIPTAPTAATTTQQLTGTSTTVFSTPDSIAALWEQGSDVASAGTISLPEGGYCNITGTTTITDIDWATDKAGRKTWVKFAGILTLTHNASTLILPTGANITTAAGDTACFISEGSDVARCVAYQRADGTSLAPLAATQAQMESASSNAVFSTPGVQHNHPGHPKFWAYVTVSGGTPTLQTSYNVTSITDTATGRLTVTIATDFSSASWCCSVSTERVSDNTNTSDHRIANIGLSDLAAGTVIVECREGTGASLVDPSSWHVVGLGDQ